MERALFLAERGRGRTTPNPIVGAVVVSETGVVVGQGAHLVAGGPHAEVVALANAGAAARGATIYCTLEPCSHVGRTGPCVERVVAAGIRRVVVAITDPNPLVGGRGLEDLRAHGIEVTEAVGREEAVRQHAAFTTWVTAHRPFVTAKAAVSADGFVGRRTGRVKLTGPAADRYFHRQRAEMDAIAVGAGTVLVDDPQLTARGAYRFRPLTRVVFDWRGRVPAAARVFSTLSAGPVIMVVGAEAAAARREHFDELVRRGVTIETPGDRALTPVLEGLARRDVVSLLVEGGSELHHAFAEADLIDRVQLVTTPTRLGDGLPLGIPRLSGPERTVALGDDTLVEVDVHRTDRGHRAH